MICRVWDSGTTDSFLNQISSDLYSCNTCSKYLYTSFIISLQQFSLLLNLFLQKNVVFSMIFKACVRYYHQIFIFPPNDSPSKTMKNAFYFIKKALFVLKIIKFLYFRPSLFFSLSTIALEDDRR